VKEHGNVHKVAFYADIFYNSQLSPAYWTPPANLDVDVILLGGDIHYAPEQLGEMLAGHGLKGVDDIRTGDRYLTLRDTNELHAAARDFIARELRALSPEERAKTIVCTHFWPTLRPWTDEAGRPLDGHPESQWLPMTGSDLDELIAGAGPRYWLCGHAHTTHQVTIGTTHVESNPRAGDGPGHVNPEFAESYVVEL
jgi:Icc-related predicted phosphoesterase